jgi:hypothetical protein
MIQYLEYKPDGGLKSLLDVSGLQSTKPQPSESLDTSDADLSGISPDSEPAKDASKAAVMLTPHFKPNLTIQAVNVFDAFVEGRLPAQMADEIVVSHDVSGYYPVVQISDFWLLRVCPWPLIHMRVPKLQRCSHHFSNQIERSRK